MCGAIAVEKGLRVIRARDLVGLGKGVQVHPRSHAQLQDRRAGREVPLEDLDQLPPVITLGHFDVFVDVFWRVIVAHWTSFL